MRRDRLARPDPLARRRAAALVLLVAGVSGCAPFLVWEGRDPPGRREVALLEQGGEQYLRVAGVEGHRYRAVSLEGLAFGPRGRLAYPALRAEGWVAVVDGVESAAYDGLGAIVFSPDGGHVAFAAELGGEWLVVLDGVIGPRWSEIARGTLGFGDDERLSYAAARDGRIRVVAGANEGPPFGAITELVRARGTGRVTYLAYRGLGCGAAVEGREAEARLDLEGCEALVARPGRGGFVFAARRNGERRLFTEEGEVPGSLGVEPASVRLSDDGARLAFAKRAGGSVWVDVDGRAFGPYAAAEPVDFAARGAHFGFIARQGGRSLVVVDGEPRGAHDQATDLQLRGAHVAYLASDGGGTSFVDHDGVRFAADRALGGSLVLSEDGGHWACVVGRVSDRRAYVAVDGRLVRELDFRELASPMARGLDTRGVTAHLRDLVRAALAERAVPRRRE